MTASREAASLRSLRPLVLLLALAGATPARADRVLDRARVAAARELVAAMQAVDGVKRALPMLAGSVRSVFVKARPETEADIDEAIAPPSMLATSAARSWNASPPSPAPPPGPGSPRSSP